MIEKMDNFEEQVQYFVDLVRNNIDLATTNKPEGISKKEMIFFNWNMRQDGQELAIYNQKEDLIYEISTKKIKDFKFKNINKDDVLNLITLLNQYSNKKITFKNLIKLYNNIKEDNIMDIIDYDKIEIEFDDFSIVLDRNVIEKFQVQKAEQFIEAKYEPEDKYNVYIVINRTLAEKIWQEEATREFERNSKRMGCNIDKFRWNTTL